MNVEFADSAVANLSFCLCYDSTRPVNPTIRTYPCSWRRFFIFLAQTVGQPVHKIDLERATAEKWSISLTIGKTSGEQRCHRIARLSAIKSVLAHAISDQL